MTTLTVRVEDFLTNYDKGTAEICVEELETLIQDLNQEGYDPRVSNAVYDRLVDILEAECPDSPVLKELWDDATDDVDNTDSTYTDILALHPMHSIRTVKSYEDKVLKEFLSNLGDEDLFLSLKINGHGIRVVYENGYLVYASSRARASAGRELTKQMVNILGEYNPNLVNEGVLDIRGEVCLRNDKLEEARKFNPGIKSAFSAVSSLIKPSSTPEENVLLDFLAYNIYTKFSTVKFSSREETYRTLSTWGFDVPDYVTMDGPINLEDLQATIEDFETTQGNADYFTDGVVAQYNSTEYRDRFGFDGKYNEADVALKVGYWKQDLYEGIVQEIIWTRGKSKLSPVALVAEVDGDPNQGVLTAQGNRVRRVPLYEPANILVLDAYPGQVLNFRYGGEAGVVPSHPDGTLLTDSAVRELLSW